MEWHVKLSRFMLAIIFHFNFESKIRLALARMKYVTRHYDNFESPGTAFFIAILQLLALIFIEVINIFNLTHLDNIYDLVFDFISLGIIADFGNYFVKPFRGTRIEFFFGTELPITNYRTKKQICCGEQGDELKKDDPTEDENGQIEEVKI